MVESGGTGTEGWGDRLRARARELGLTDTEIGRRLGMTQRRYSSYVNMSREPNFQDLARICAVLGVTTDHVLGIRPVEAREDAERRAIEAIRMMPPRARELAVAAL